MRVITAKRNINEELLVWLNVPFFIYLFIFFCRRKYLLDGLISAASSDAVAAMRDEINTGTVKPDVVNRWITSLAFIPK